MSNSRISYEQVEEAAKDLYRHLGFLPDSVINLPPEAIKEMFDRGELVQTEDGDIVQISKETQLMTEEEKINHDALVEEQKYYEWLALSPEEKIAIDPIRYADEVALKNQEGQTDRENTGEV